jgi:hypothetical protein
VFAEAEANYSKPLQAFARAFDGKPKKKFTRTLALQTGIERSLAIANKSSSYATS